MRIVRQIKEYYNIALTIFFRFIIYFHRKSHGFSNDEIFVGFSSAWFGGNVKGLLDALLKKEDLIKEKKLHFYFLSSNKEQVDIARGSGVEAYWWHDFKAIQIFSKSKMFITSHGESSIPVTRRIAFIDFLKDSLGEFGNRFDMSESDFFGKGFIVKRLELWHGIPFKDVYIDKIPIPPDVFCVTSEFMKKSYASKGYDPKIFQITGFPRNDILFKNIDKKKIFSELNIPIDKKIILYAPTWGHYTGMSLFPWGDWKKTLINLNEFAEKNDGVHFIIRTHKYWEGEESDEIDQILSKCSNISWVSMKIFPDTYSLLNCTDVLITDWSSIAFDFMLKRKPIIFIDRPNPYGMFCFTPEERAGAIVKNYDELIKSISDSFVDSARFIKKYAPNFDIVLDKAFLYKDDKASERCIEEMLKLLEN